MSVKILDAAVLGNLGVELDRAGDARLTGERRIGRA